MKEEMQRQTLDAIGGSVQRGVMLEHRIVNPYNLAERPTFLPGDEVADKHDVSGKVWRIVRRTAYGMSELMTLREVGNDSNERTLMSDQLVPHLRMVAMSVRA